MNQSLEDRRRELWIGVCIAATRKATCWLDNISPSEVANEALAEFDKVFHNSEQKELSKIISEVK